MLPGGLMSVVSFNTFALHFLRKWAQGGLMYAKLYFAGSTQQSSVTSDSCTHCIYLHQGNCKQCIFITPSREQQQQQVIFVQADCLQLYVCFFELCFMPGCSLVQVAVR